MRIYNILLAALVALLGSTTCHAAGTKGDNQNQVVKGIVMHNYFHNNDAGLPASPLIATQQEFDTQFSPAAFMGKGGQPTPVNFKKQAVVAIVLPVTDRDVAIDSVRLTQAGTRRLLLSYVVTEGARRSYSVQPIWLMAVGKQYRGYEVQLAPRVVKTVSEHTADYRFVAYSNTARHIALTVDYPTGGNAATVDSLRAYIRTRFEALQTMWLGHDQACTPLRYAGNPDNADDFVEYAAETTASSMLDALDSFSLAEGRYAIQMDIRRVDEDTAQVSYQATGYAYMGGAHGLGFTNGITISKHDGHRMTLVNASDSLRRLVTQRLHQTEADIHFDTEPVPMPATAPYLKDGKIVFVYQPYEIGPYAIGMPECAFYPYEIEDALTDEAKRIAR